MGFPIKVCVSMYNCDIRKSGILLWKFEYLILLLTRIFLRLVQRADTTVLEKTCFWLY